MHTSTYYIFRKHHSHVTLHIRDGSTCFLYYLKDIKIIQIHRSNLASRETGQRDLKSANSSPIVSCECLKVPTY